MLFFGKRNENGATVKSSDHRTRMTGLFGHPVEHSLSPVFMNRIFKALRMSACYLAFDIDPGNFAGAFAALKIFNFTGVNITIPYKQLALQYAEHLSEDARCIGAVNCVVHREGTLHGHNTDHLGFILPLERHTDTLEGSAVLLLGCGGAARSVLFALAKKGVEKVHLVNRTEKNAMAFIRWSKERIGFSGISFTGDARAITRQVLEEVDVVIHTTPVGMFPDTGLIPIPENLRFAPGQIVYDLIYNPWKTRLLKKAEEEGATGINGFAMLILQGLHSLALWFPEKSDALFRLRRMITRYAKKHLQEKG
jgi:shikimate dehydrogenase